MPKGDESKVLLGEPVDASVDVGAAVRKGEEVQVRVYSGSSVLDAGSPTGETSVVGRVLSPLARKEIGTIRCIGLNVSPVFRGEGVLYADRNPVQEARRGSQDVDSRHPDSLPVSPRYPRDNAPQTAPDNPTSKPDTCLADPWPAPTIIPKHTIESDSADYESELAIVIGKEAKNVSEADALDYVLGYTASNDISSRASQFAQTQWCYSKGFDGACPIGPVLVAKEVIPDVGKLQMRGLKNGKVLQESPLT